jgi:hypothetical protein
MTLRARLVTLTAFGLLGCGSSGSLTGKVTVEGGSAANVAVFIYGPQSVAAVTKEDGTFAASGLPDGQYVVRGLVRGAEVEEVSVPAKVTGGKAESEPTLAFKFRPVVAPGKIVGRVTVENGAASGITVFIAGPQSSVATTGADGSFTSGELPDGQYAVRAMVRGAAVEEVTALAKLTAGKLDAEPVLAFALPPVTTVTGKVAFSDASDAGSLTVSLTGEVSRATRTDGAGTFTFAGVPAGAYIAAVEAPDTREGRVGLGVAVSGATQDVGELRLTPVGRVGGVVTASSMPVSGATVVVSGSGLSATTNAAGRFEFVQVPTGDVTVVARTSSPSRAGSVTQRLARGANMDVAITLTDDARTGTVSGVVTFTGPQSPTIITVSATGTTATTSVGVNGAFSLTVPAGTVEVVATAPMHPRQVLGQVVVGSGQTVTLPGAVLSWYSPLWSSGNWPISSVNVSAVSATQPWVLLASNDNQTTRNLLVNTVTRDVRLVALGTVNAPVFSSAAKYLAFGFAGQVMTYEIATGQLRSRGVSGNSFDFSTDETVLFIERSTFLERITLSTSMSARFPSIGTSNAIVRHTADRWLVRESTSSDVQLVEPTQVTPSLFMNAAVLTGFPTPMALTQCGPSTCTLRVVAPAAQVSRVVVGAFPQTGTLTGIGTGDFAIVANLATMTQFVVRTSDGALYPLPSGASQFAFSPSGTRFAYLTGNGFTGFALREDTLPPTTGTPASIATGFTIPFAYFSPTRLVAVEQTGARRIIDVRNGTVTVDTDALSSPATVFTPGLVVWPVSSTSKWKAIVGDKAPIEIDLSPTATSVQSLTARPGEPATEYGAVSFDAASAWVIDGRQLTARRVIVGQTSGSSAERSGMNEVYSVLRGGISGLVMFSNDQVFERLEPRFIAFGVTSALAGGERVYFAIDNTQRTIFMAGFR